MRATFAKCLACGAEYDLKVLYTCPKCGGILDIHYNYAGLRGPGSAEHPGIWRHLELLPAQGSSLVSLGEGDTPLLSCPRLGERLGLPRLYVKDETVEPTGSFKDRPLSVATTKAREFGFTTVTTASSGNAGASAAAYAARAGLTCYIFVPVSTPVGKLTQIRMYGARLVLVEGTYSDAHRLAKELAIKRGWLNLTTTFASPYPTEGNKTLAYELCEQMRGEVPDWVLIPVGSGPLLAGAYKGFQEFRLLGLVDRIPKFVAVQAEGCAPVARAFAAGAAKVTSWEEPHTIASGIRDPLTGYEQDGEHTLRIVRESGGQAVAVGDDEIMRAAHELGAAEGVYAEPTGAAVVAGAAKLFATGAIKREQTVVCVVTGSGLKETPVYTDQLDRLPIVPANVEAVEAHIDSLG